MRASTKHAWSAFSVLLVVLGSSACSADDRGGAVAATPSVGGPWAEEFSEALRDASANERRILSDGVITSAERNEAQHRKRQCMRDLGYDYEDFDDGTAEAERLDGADLDAEAINGADTRCSHQWDRSVTYLYNEVRRNPQKLDEAKITVACLRQSGLVGEDYTERQWRADNDTGVWPFDDYDPRAVQCRLDPLGLWRDQ